MKIRNDWKALWYSMAEQKASEYEIIKATPVFEFWSIYDLWLERLEAKTKNMKKNERRL